MRNYVLVRSVGKVFKGHSGQAIKYEIPIDTVAMEPSLIFGYYK